MFEIFTCSKIPAGIQTAKLVIFCELFVIFAVEVVGSGLILSSVSAVGKTWLGLLLQVSFSISCNCKI